MKKLIFIGISFIVLSNTILPAEEPLKENTSSPENNSFISVGDSIITHNGLFYRYPGSYSLSNGTSLKYAELTEQLRLIPENEPYVRGVAIWDALHWGLFGIDVGLLGGLTYCMVTDGFKPTDRIITLLISTAAVWSLGFCAGEGAKLNLTKAVNNYNLTVMGIPIH